jgi:hypothetical protein
MTQIRQHDYVDGVCQHCGDKETDNKGEHAERLCVSRETPRSIPVSIFANLGEIGNRLKEIRAEEAAIRGERPIAIEPIAIDYEVVDLAAIAAEFQERLFRVFGIR